MPWSPKDAKGKTKDASTPEKRKRWAAIANHVLARTGDEAMAIRMANQAMHGKAHAR